MMEPQRYQGRFSSFPPDFYPVCDVMDEFRRLKASWVDLIWIYPNSSVSNCLAKDYQFMTPDSRYSECLDSGRIARYRNFRQKCRATLVMRLNATSAGNPGGDSVLALPKKPHSNGNREAMHVRGSHAAN